MTDPLAPNGKAYESVWDYPRPPAVQRVPWRIEVRHGGITIVDAPEAIRILETSQPPAYYVAPEYIAAATLQPSERRSWCEFKGEAHYADVVIEAIGERCAAAAWSYPDPTEPYREIAGYWAFYAQRLEECWIDAERVIPNEGGFYGGWITAQVIGPFKGAPGTEGW